MDAVIWYRDSCVEKYELEAMKKYFNCVDSRILIKPGQLAISRFSCLPYYKEQARDIDLIGAKLINSYNEHRYVADLSAYYIDLKDLTPKTWFSIDEIDDDGPFVLKGATNSRKNRWRTHMFAKDLRAAREVYWELSNDSLIQDSQQQICIRKFVKLYKYFDGVNGMPITKEFRFFMYKDVILSSAYYWSGSLDEPPDASEVPIEFIQNVAKRVKNKIKFYVIDVGQLETGEWIVIELNSGQMAGLSDNDPEVLYSSLAAALQDDSQSFIT
ncbi:MAG: ATP-grasp domain-containing protein [bacterium]|nr:ATP-grasp domain-containing protein [bacterium]